MLGLRFCARASSSCGKWGPPFIAVRGPLTVAASLVAEHRLQTRRLSSCGSRALEHRLSSCGSQAQLLRGMWDLPRPGLEPMSPALAGGSQPLHHQGSPQLLLDVTLFHSLCSSPLSALLFCSRAPQCVCWLAASPGNFTELSILFPGLLKQNLGVGPRGLF